MGKGRRGCLRRQRLERKRSIKFGNFLNCTKEVLWSRNQEHYGSWKGIKIPGSFI